MIGNSIAGFLEGGAATATSSYESIATVSPSGATVSFTSIPATYKHLQIRYIAKDNSVGTTGSRSMDMQFNSDTAANYAYHTLYGTGATATSTGTGSVSSISILGIPGNGVTANMFGAGIIDILDYANTSKNKTVKTFAGTDLNNTSGAVALDSGLWRSTAAVSSIQIITTFVAGSIFALYGIKG